jgi:dienelactone hydrolase
LRLFGVGAAALLTVLAATAAAPEVEVELARTFDRGFVHFRIDGATRSQTIADALPALRKLDPFAFRATVVYLHGCDGVNAISTRTADLLAASGYLVFVPDSFARTNKPVSCDVSRFEGGLHREVLAWRQAEAGYALKQVKALPSVDPARIFLMGLSEGAIATATFAGEPLAGRVIEGWTCHAGWPEYRGLAASRGEPVLALSSENDPWFQDPVLRGDCAEYLGPPSPLRRSIVFRPPHPAASQHDLMWNLDARRLVLDFLARAAPR